jgi:hypothetical protein
MDDDSVLLRVGAVAETVVRRVDDRWQVFGVEFTPQHIAVFLGLADGDGEPVTALYSLGRPEADAIAGLAAQIQDHAIEASGGRALPACPGHPHPLRPRVVHGAAVWECPRTPAHYREPIWPA